jgi:hypothetical protein
VNARAKSRRISVCAFGLILLTGCNWLSLAKNAVSYPTLKRGEASNVAATDSLLYVAKGEDGLAIVDARSGSEIGALAPPTGSESIDDIAIDGSLLFVLDARAPGHVSVFSLGNSRFPRLVAAPREVPVGPFSGVSAAAGLCVVSGGTSQLEAFHYDSAGVLTGPVATTDLGRGQPDALVAADGRRVYVSTHYWGPYFGIDVLRYDSTVRVLNTLAKLELDGAGFTSGGAKPANFPIVTATLGGDTLLVAFAKGLALIDVRNAARPSVLQIIDVGGSAVSVDSYGSSAAVAVTAPNASLVILGFDSRGSRVVRRISLPPGTLPTGVALTAAIVSVTARDRGVLVFSR